VYATGAALPVYPGQIANLKLFVDGTSSWNINKAIISDVNPEVDIEGGTLEGYTVNFSFAGADDGSGGSITSPDGTVLDRDTTGDVTEA